MGLLLGAPLQENPQLLCNAASILRQQLQDEYIGLLQVTTKRKLEDSVQNNYNRLKGVEVEELEVPSVETFNRNFFIPQIPVKLKGIGLVSKVLSYLKGCRLYESLAGNEKMG